jgi:putative ABC transport system ATP-binding protein
MKPPLISFANVARIYGMGEAEVQALAGVDFEIRAGEFVAIMGPSGSGKSTAMNIIGCLDQPTFGTYSFAGADISTLDRDQQAMLRRYYLGFVFQGFNLLARTTALENVELPLIYRGLPRSERRDAAYSALAKVGLTGRENHVPSELSGGQQQRVAIARALVGTPQVILADEPTGNLDTHRSHEIMELLVRLNQDEGITIAMVTHEDEMAAYASRNIIFSDGKIAYDGVAQKPVTREPAHVR